MLKKTFCALTLFALVGGVYSQSLMAEEADPMAAVKTDKGLISLTKAAPELTLTSDYTGDIWNRSTALGDVLSRQELYEKGISYDVQLTQVYQGISSGGPDDHVGARYNGLVDYGINLDTGKLGWWSGGMIFLSANSSFGNDETLVGETGTLVPVNYTAMWPEPGKNSTFLMNYYLMQALPYNTLFLIGRLNPVLYLDRNKFANSPRNQFLNVAMGNNPLMGAFSSFSTYGILTTTKVTDYFGFNLAVADGSIQPGDYDGSDAASGGFFEAVETAVDMQFHWKIGGDLNGDFDFTWLWVNNDPTDFSNPRITNDILTGQTLPTKGANNILAVNIQQYLWKPAGASDQSKSKTVRTEQYDYQEPGLGLFFRASWLPEDRNPYNIFVSGGIGGRGVFTSRPYDRFGLGFYWFKESDDLDKLPGNLLEDELGFEAFYNVALTPWVGLTADVQWIDSAVRDTDDTVILGTRLNIIF